MNVIRVNTSSPYPVITGSGLLAETGRFIRQYAPDAVTAALVTDDTVEGLYGGRVRESLLEAGFQVLTFVLPHGEASKCGESYLRLLEFLANGRLSRSDLIVALGGGVVGDLAGFAAATYLRGIRFVQIPTTLLAQVDSSVGGKTAIDLPSGKNLAGAFYQPVLVLCDPDSLDTLPPETLTDGCAEVIKYGVLMDEKLFQHMKERGIGFDRDYIVTRCIEMKRDIVSADEFDCGQRQLLNLGHTLGHAAEMLSCYRLSHGRAVAMGMAVIARAAAADGICSSECAAEIAATLQRFCLPVSFEYTLDEVYQVMLSDKKRRGDRISLVIPVRIGHCEIREYTLDGMRSFIGRVMCSAEQKEE